MIQSNAMQLLWRVQHGNASEIQAGGRAIFSPSPIHTALSSASGRMTARVIVTLGYPPRAQNFARVRTPFLTHLVTKSIAPDCKHPLTADLFAGYSTMGMDIAAAVPHGTHYDMNRKGIVEEIQRRLDSAKRHGFEVPKNHHLITVDYSEQELLSFFKRPVDVLVSNNAYYTREENLDIFRYLRGLLGEYGVLVTSFGSGRAIEELRNSIKFFRSQIGDIPFPIYDGQQILDLVYEAGYRHADVFLVSELADTLGYPKPIMDIEYFVVAYK